MKPRLSEWIAKLSRWAEFTPHLFNIKVILNAVFRILNMQKVRGSIRANNLRRAYGASVSYVLIEGE